MTINLLLVDEFLRSVFDREELEDAFERVEYCNSLEEGEIYLSPDKTVQVAVVTPFLDIGPHYQNTVALMRALKKKGTKVIFYDGIMENDVPLPIPEDSFDVRIDIYSMDEVVDQVRALLND